MGQAQRPLLIKHGWDLPYPAWIQGHVREMEQLGFDGVVTTLVDVTSCPSTLEIASRLDSSAANSSASVAAKPSLKIIPNPVRAGHVVTIKGSADGCPVRDTVTLISHAFRATHRFAGVPAVLTKVRAGGLFRTTTTIPYGKHGTYSVTARCGGGNLGVLFRLRVT